VPEIGSYTAHGITFWSMLMVDHKNDSNWENLYSQSPGNPYASLSMLDEDSNSPHQEPTVAQKREYLRKLQNPPAHIEIFGDLDSEEITEEWLLTILSSYLPKSPQSSDRKVIRQIAADFEVQAKDLTLNQKKFLKHRVVSMEPEGRRPLAVARTTLDSIKNKLQKLLDEAKKK
jgi:hypothetical protein